MVEGTPMMHVNLVIILEMGNKSRNVTHHRALGSSIGAIVWTKSTVLLVLKLGVVWKYIVTTIALVSARKFQ